MLSENQKSLEVLTGGGHCGVEERRRRGLPGRSILQCSRHTHTGGHTVNKYGVCLLTLENFDFLIIKTRGRDVNKEQTLSL